MDKEDAEFMKDKIKSHFLFPAVRLLMEKCDMATQTLDPMCMEIDDLFELLENLKKKEEEETGRDQEIDVLMYNTVFMLRVHLMELSKLKSLVDRFKVTYCSQLKRQFAKDSENSSPKESEDEGLMESINQDIPLQLQLNQMQYLFPFHTVEQLAQIICKEDNNVKIVR